jgi:hypothetical protein
MLRKTRPFVVSMRLRDFVKPRKQNDLHQKTERGLNSRRAASKKLRLKRRHLVNLYSQSLLNQLTLEQLEEAMLCLHNDLHPQDQRLKDLSPSDWGVLVTFLSLLMREKSASSLH